MQHHLIIAHEFVIMTNQLIKESGWNSGSICRRRTGLADGKKANNKYPIPGKCPFDIAFQYRNLRKAIN